MADLKEEIPRLLCRLSRRAVGHDGRPFGWQSFGLDRAGSGRCKSEVENPLNGRRTCCGLSAEGQVEDDQQRE